MSVQHLKPFASIDEDERKEIFNEWRGKAAGNIQAQRDAVERDMERAFEQAGPDLDLEKIDTVGGSTLSEKCEGLVALHSKLSGLEDALAERTELDKVAKDIREGNRGGAHADAQPPQPVIVRNPEPPSLANMFFDDLLAAWDHAGADGGKRGGWRPCRSEPGAARARYHERGVQDRRGVGALRRATPGLYAVGAARDPGR